MQYRISKKDSILLKFKRRTVRISLQKHHFINIVTFESTATHLADIHLKNTVQPQGREKGN